MIITIDGPAGTGKSTVAKLLAEKLGFVYLDTGAMYRAVTLYFLDNNINFDDEELIKSKMDEINITFNKTGTLLNNVDVSKEIRSDRVNKNVSPVSSLKAVRDKLTSLQRKCAVNTSLVCEGRDMGSVVFPNAEHKFFLSASVDVRAKRRYDEELQKGMQPDFDEIKKSIQNRDNIDSNRDIAPLKKAEDAIEIDTSFLGIQDVLELLADYVEGKDVI